MVTVLGLDIKPGYSPRSREPPRYSCVVVRDGEVLARYDDIPLHRVIRYLIEFHVDILAIDSISEIAESARDIIKLSQVIPSWCKVVEVTWTPEGYKPVEYLARLHGLQPPSDPLTTAYVNALLAMKGCGREVKLHGDRVYIIVSKGRTPRQGGSSTERFKRNIRAAVLNVVREIKEILQVNNIDFDLVVKESDGGLERGMFIVYAPPEKVRELVKPINYKNVKVRIDNGTLLDTPRRVRRWILVGIDPGTSVGLAILDLDGTPLLVKTYKTPDREIILNSILAHGYPLIIAVDVKNPPEYVKKISSILNATIYTPEYDLPVDEKQKLVLKYMEGYNIEVSDSHARDALAAAIKAYGYLKPLVDEINSKLRGIVEIDRGEVVNQVIRGRPLSEVLEEAFKSILLRDKHRTVSSQENKSSVKESLDEESMKLRVRVMELEQTIRRLEEELERKQREIEDLRVELNYLRKQSSYNEDYERRMYQLQVEVSTLKRLLEDKTHIIESLKDRVSLLERLIISVARGEYILACKSSRIELCSNQPIFLDNILSLEQALDIARRSKTGIIVTQEEGLNWRNLRVPIVTAMPVLDLGDYVLLESRVLSEIRSQWNKIEELEVQERRRKIIEMIKEYQESRKNLE